MKPAYNRQLHQSYYRNNNSSRYGARSRNTRSGWQAASHGSYRASYQPWTGSNSAEDKELEANYTEEEVEVSAEDTQVYQPESASTQEIDPVVTLERICSWLGDILRKPDLAWKLAEARLELGKDEQGNNKATFWLTDERLDPRSFSIGDKSLIRMAFSTEVERGYQLQIGSGQIIVSLE
jgi:hypothetical protein